MNSIKKIFLLSSILLLLAEMSFAQSFYNSRINRKWMASGGVGYARSLTDLTNPGSYFDTKLNFEGSIVYIAAPRVNIRTHLLLFQLAGDDAKLAPELGTRVRDLSFVSNNIELGVTGAISLFPMSSRFVSRKLINPYLFGGVGLLFFDPRAEVPDRVFIPGMDTVSVPRAGEMVSLRQYQTERPNTYGRFAVVFPIGVGVRVKVTNFMDITAEASNRITFTDYLDDVSGRGYPDPSNFDMNKPEDVTAYALSNKIGRPTGTRGNPESNDYYFIFNVKADFYIQGTFFNKVFGIGGRKFNVSPKRRNGGLFKKRRR